MQLPSSALQLIKQIPTYGPRLVELFNAVQKQATIIEKQGNLNATGDPPVPPPPDALNVTNGPSGEFQIAITHNGEFNRGTTFHTQWDTSPHFTNPHNIDHGASRNDSSLNLPGQTVYFRSAAASPSGAPSAWTYHGSQNRPTPVVGGVPGVRAPGMGSGVGPPGDQVGGPGGFQERNSATAFAYKLQQRTAGPGFGASAQGSPAGIGASAGSGGGGGGGSTSLSESTIAPCEWLSSVVGTNTVTAVTGVPYSALAPGFSCRFVPANTNSGAVTLNVNSIGAKAVTKFGTTALSGGELVVGTGYVLLYDGTRFQIIGTFAVTESMVAGCEWLTGVAGTNTITGATATAYAALVAGFMVRIIPANTNSGAATLNVNGIGASPVTKNGAAALVGGELVAGTGYDLLWDGTEWQILGQISTPFAPTIATFTPVIQIGGSTTGVTFTFTATSSKTGAGTGAPVIAVINVTITGWPAVPSGTVTIGGLPVSAGAVSVGTFAATSGFVGLTAGVPILPVLSGTTVTLDTQGVTGLTALPATAIANGSVFTITMPYQSA